MNWIKYQDYSDNETFKAGTLLKLINGDLIMLGDASIELGTCNCCSIKDVYEPGGIEFYCNDFIEECNYIKENSNKYPLEFINYRLLCKKIYKQMKYDIDFEATYSPGEKCFLSYSELNALKELLTDQELQELRKQNE